MHNVTVVGNLGRDPELRYTSDDTPVTTFSVCDNGHRDKPVWFRVTAWRRLAEVCNQYLTKGRSVVVQGRLQGDDDGGPRIWTGQDGQPRASFEVTAASVEFLSGGAGDGQHDGGHQEHTQGEQRPYGASGGEPPEEGPENEEVIPF